MSAPLTIYFVRHGEVHNPDKILYGRMRGFGLSDTGRGQASAAARVLGDQSIAAIYASPMQRAQETAKIIATAQPRHQDVITDERLNEVYSPFDGTTHEDMDAIKFDLYTGVDEEYEQPRDIRRRVTDFIAEMREKHANESIVAVTHGDIVVAMFMYAMGQDENDIGRTRHDEGELTRLLELGLPEAYPATASLSALTWETNHADEVPQYEYLNPYA